MFDTDKCYKFDFLGKKECFTKPNVTHLSTFRFKAAKRRYFVTIEHYTFDVVGIKYCDVDDKDSINAYTKIFNDNDGFRVIATCIKIMHNLIKNNPSLSFAFYASPRDASIEDLIAKKKNKDSINTIEFIENYKRCRFHIYEHAMINLFQHSKFFHIKNWDTCIYILLNKKNQKPNLTVNKIGKFLLQNHQIIFEPTTEKIIRKSEIRIG